MSVPYLRPEAAWLLCHLSGNEQPVRMLGIDIGVSTHRTREILAEIEFAGIPLRFAKDRKGADSVVLMSAGRTLARETAEAYWREFAPF